MSLWLKLLMVYAVGIPIWHLLDIRNRDRPGGTFDYTSPPVTLADVVIGWLKRCWRWARQPAEEESR